MYQGELGSEAYIREQKLKIIKTHEDLFSSVKVRRCKILTW